MMTNRKWGVLNNAQASTPEEVLAVLLENRCMRASDLSVPLGGLEAYLSMRGLDEAAAVTADHVAAGRKVLLVGDYDCDGITSLAQLIHFFRDIGFDNYAAVIPRRSEGYGVPGRILEEHRDACLILAVDCGTHDRSVVNGARALGMDVVVIDHHEVYVDRTAPCTVLVNPKHPLCPSVFKEFSAAGLTLLFLARLRKELPQCFTRPRLGSKFLALAAIGTISDLVPLIEANRTIARHGLMAINDNGAFPPLTDLVQVCGLAGKSLNSNHISFHLGPRINAAGRVGDPAAALALLVADDVGETRKLAGELNRLNTCRQQQEERIVTQLRQGLAEHLFAGRTFLAGDSGWPHGLVGIVASRIQKEIHYGPTVALSVDPKERIARGSARSIPGFDLLGALQGSEDLLIRWGGHKMAAGLMISTGRIEAFARRFEEYAGACPSEVFTRSGLVDMVLSLDLVSSHLLKVLETLAPHGQGNPLPCFGARGVRVAVQRVFGKERNHLQLVVNDRLPAIFWRGLPQLPPASPEDGCDMVFHIERDGATGEPILNVKALEPFGLGDS